MAESYIPEDTNVICTLQTVPSPLQIKQYRNQAFTIHDAKDKVLLNIDDKKISGPFECVNIGSFWGGLMTLCLGIAVGALIAAATILTGGLALVALGVGLVACGIGIGAGIAALCQIPHACDVTLSSNWLEFHPDVNIEGQSALLNASYLKCNNGGLVNLIIDPVIAQAAAQQIGDHNMNYFLIHLGENFLQGLLSSPILNPTSPDMIKSVIFAVGSYCIFEDGLNDHEDPQTAGDVAVSSTLDAFRDEIIEEVTDMIISGKVGGDSFTRGLIYSIYGAGHSLVGRAVGSTSDDLLGALIHGLGAKQVKTNAAEFLGSLLISVVFGIEKNSEHNKARQAGVDNNEKDSGNAISVIAIDAN